MRQSDLTERLLRLRAVPVFRSITTASLAPLAATMRAATFEKGDIVLHEDEPPRAFHMLVRGAVTMRRRGNTIRTVTAPGAVGFLSLLARTGGGTEAVAESRTETLEVRADALHELFEDHFSVLLGTLRWLAERLLHENIAQDPPPFSPPAQGFDSRIGERAIGTVARIFLLRRTMGFRHANVNSTARLARAMKEVRLPAGEVVWRPGDAAGHMLLVVKGMMELSWRHPLDGRDMIHSVGPEYMVGGVESIAGRPRWNQLKTLEPAVFLQGSREAMIDMLEDDFEVALQFISMLASFLLQMWDRKAEGDALRGASRAPPAADAAPASTT